MLEQKFFKALHYSNFKFGDGFKIYKENPSKTPLRQFLKTTFMESIF